MKAKIGVAFKESIRESRVLVMAMKDEPSMELLEKLGIIAEI